MYKIAPNKDVSSMLRHSYKRKTTTMKLFKWKSHCYNCQTCNKVSTIKNGGRRPKKVKLGRPKAETHIWSRAILNKVFAEVSHNNKSFSKFNISDLNMELNNHLELYAFVNYVKIVYITQSFYKNVNTHFALNVYFHCYKGNMKTLQNVQLVVRQYYYKIYNLRKMSTTCWGV